MLFLTVAVSVSHAMHATAVNSPLIVTSFYYWERVQSSLHTIFIGHFYDSVYLRVFNVFF